KSDDYQEPEEFQEAMDRLEEVTSELESGDLPLELAMDHYQEGLKLIEFCEERLEEAELLVEKIEDPGADVDKPGRPGQHDDE
ncbi:MAG: exodeoxyribonuclease VII small subunit, partial [bacterium]